MALCSMSQTLLNVMPKEESFILCPMGDNDFTYSIVSLLQQQTIRLHLQNPQNNKGKTLANFGCLEASHKDDPPSRNKSECDASLNLACMPSLLHMGQLLSIQSLECLSRENLNLVLDMSNWPLKVG